VNGRSYDCVDFIGMKVVEMYIENEDGECVCGSGK